MPCRVSVPSLLYVILLRLTPLLDQLPLMTKNGYPLMRRTLRQTNSFQRFCRRFFFALFYSIFIRKQCLALLNQLPANHFQQANIVSNETVFRELRKESHNEAQSEPESKAHHTQQRPQSTFPLNTHRAILILNGKVSDYCTQCFRIPALLPAQPTTMRPAYKRINVCPKYLVPI